MLSTDMVQREISETETNFKPFCLPPPIKPVDID